MKLFYIVIGFLLLISCDRLIVDDLSDKHIHLLKPQNNSYFTQSNVQFTWAQEGDVDSYQLLIIKGIFSNPEALILDTLVNALEYTHLFAPGKYMWTVNAVNYHSMANGDTFNFTIDSAGSVINKPPLLLSPGSEFTNNKEISFIWGNVIVANKYRFDLRAGEWGNNNIQYSTITNNTQIEQTLAHGTYSWGVQAIQGNLFSPYAYQSIVVDTAAPDIPELVTPTDNSSTAETNVTLTWKRNSTELSPEFDSIAVSTSAVFHKDSTTYFQSELNNISVALSSDSKYYWSVKTSDKAGNSSNYAQAWSFLKN